MKSKRRGYSIFIKPIFLLVDLLILNILLFLLGVQSNPYFLFPVYICVIWIILSIATGFYDTKRFSKVIQTLSSLLRQFIIFALILYAFVGFFKQPEISRLDLAKYFFVSFISVSFAKYLLLYLLNKYRKILGGNFRNVVVIGNNKKTNQLIETFKERSDFGYKFHKNFCVRKDSFDLQNCFRYILDKEIDEIYCSVAEVTNKQLREIVNFTDNNLKVLKFIPDNKDIFTKKLVFNYYGYVPVLSFREIPLDDPINKFVKRCFDIILALAVMVFILSWLTPLLFFLMQLESKGPVFFMQRRNGIDYREFYCYKYRSMTPNTTGNQTIKGDARVTKIGKFIRKTSIDELPQFINVLKGDMSVVGPRPHMVKHNEDFARKVDKFMVRHFVKPGISGLAQVSGFRGEIETDKDIVNRVKYDIFYIENWSLLLDIKIIFLTILNALKGEEKAY
ncbi:exopolysaccharide biosynthesis polyprenyl glycosylphosphotransferase [Aquimarina sp. MMG015]|uniref:exopolysaccharide biosynthesis polyprenyl glycosylphosphotransferase n=1 Tax=Aquimarina sp. MMG015 TaxID=2822689 RepID=UPI001B3A7903|nr:exopolysaccharide biosynthesis polyprenyl glycosylphosphotransferase [Aquimarina sp. MMG015]MBQ4801406.1 exopolysaccharide biosynthesis polyprenyl glycosylphosphotransferase [Aquimarina sp. MMG015]